MGRLIESLRKAASGTVLYNYLFIVFLFAYNYLLRGLVLDTSMGAVYEVRKAPLFGIMVLLVIIAGTWALLMKCRELRSAGVKSPAGAGFLLCVLNWVVVISMVFTAVQSFGIQVTKSDELISDFENTVIIIAILSALVQGGVSFGFLVRLSEPYEKPIGQGKRAAAALVAFAYLCVAYTVVWETIVHGAISKTGSFDIRTGEGIFNIIGWLICFLLLYPPMRIPFILQEMEDGKNSRARFRITVSYILVILAGIIPLIKNPFQ
jgi:hypothetical protein